MNKRSISLLGALATVFLSAIPLASAQESPAVIWEFPTPNGLTNSIVGVGWAPGSVGQVAMGSTDRWLRTRTAATGQIQYSILGPQHSRGGDQTVYSTDGLYLAVHNRSNGLGYRVYRATDGLFLGTIVVTNPENGVVQFTADAQLQNSVPPDGTMLRWRLEEFTVVNTTGSGYNITTTTFNFSPDQLYQVVASGGTINIQSRKTGKIVGTFPGGGLHGSLPMTFSPDSTLLAIWDGDSNATFLLTVPDGERVMALMDAAENEGIGSLRFSPDGTRLVTTGYLPFQTPNGWNQKGVIRFWRLSDGMMRHQFDQHTGIGVTSPIAWSPDASQFVYGTYEGGIVAAFTPAP